MLSRRLLGLWRQAVAAQPIIAQVRRHYMRLEQMDELEEEMHKAFRFSKPSARQERRRRLRERVVPAEMALEESEAEEDEEDRELKKYLKLRKYKEDIKASRDPDVEELESDVEFSTDEEYERDRKMEAKRPLDEEGRRMWEYRDPKRLTHIAVDLERRLNELVCTLPPYDRRIAVVRLRLAMQLHAGLQDCRPKDGELEEVAKRIVSLVKEALKVFGVGSDDSTEQGLCLYVLGCAYRELRELELAQSFLRRALNYFERKEELGKQVAADKQDVLNELAYTLVDLGRTEEAVELFHHALNLLETQLEPDSVELGDECRSVAEFCCEVGEWNDAKEICEKAVRIHCKGRGHDTVDVAMDRRLLAHIYAAGFNEHDKAIEQFRICRQIYLDEKGYRGAFYATLGIADSQMMLNRLSEAVATLEGAMVPRNNIVMQGLLYVHLARAFALKKNFEEARKQCANALQFYKEKQDEVQENVDELASQLMKIAEIYDDVGDKEASIGAMEQAIAAYNDLPSADELTVNMKVHLGQQLVRYGRAGEALEYYRQGMETYQKLGMGGVNLLNLAAEAYMELGKHELAAELLKKAEVEIGLPQEKAVKPVGKPAPIVPEKLPVFRNLVKAYTALGRRDEALHSQEMVVMELRRLKEAGREVQDMLDKETSLLRSAGST